MIKLDDKLSMIDSFCDFLLEKHREHDGPVVFNLDYVVDSIVLTEQQDPPDLNKINIGLKSVDHLDDSEKEHFGKLIKQALTQINSANERYTRFENTADVLKLISNRLSVLNKLYIVIPATRTLIPNLQDLPWPQSLDADYTHFVLLKLATDKKALVLEL